MLPAAVGAATGVPAAPASAPSPTTPLCLGTLVTSGLLCTAAPLCAAAGPRRLLPTATTLGVAAGAATTRLRLAATCGLVAGTAAPSPNRSLPTTSLSIGASVLSTVRPCNVVRSYHTQGRGYRNVLKKVSDVSNGEELSTAE